jgi:NADH-quinone oxidoreductase subunit C
MASSDTQATSASDQAVSVSEAEQNVAVLALRAAFPDASVRAVSGFGADWAIVPAGLIVDACRILRDDPAARFDVLLDVTAVDLLPRAPRWEVVYNLLSTSREARFRLKIELEDVPNPEVPSVTAIHAGANWFEREVFDLLGIRFSDHPNLRRLLLPEDWQGYPLRYDHPIGGEEVGFTS